MIQTLTVCPECHGSKLAPCGDPWTETLDPCGRCDGTGAVSDAPSPLESLGYGPNEEAEDAAWAEHAEWCAKEERELEFWTRMAICVHYCAADPLDGADSPEACGLRPC